MAIFNEEKQEEQVAEMKKKEEESLIIMLSQKYGYPYVDMRTTAVSNKSLAVLDEKDAQEAQIGVFDLVRKKLKVAVFSPNNEKTKDALNALEQKGYSLELYMTTHEGLKKIWDRYKDLSYSEVEEEGVLNLEIISTPEVAKHIVSKDTIAKYLLDLADKKSTHRLSNMLAVIIGGAIELGASDIHLEGIEGGARLRFRLDGVLQDVAIIPPRTYELLVSRIKLLSGLKLNVTADTQDGRFSIRLVDKQMDVRVSVLPGAYGEGIVMRILNPDSISVELESMGMRENLYSLLMEEVKKPDGMILTTGPTGSGKTTTLYAFLRKVYTPEIKVITIEDPIEYHLEGVSQTQTDSDSNYTFSSGLRAALRQDPDVVMVGEIRDSETAKIAIDAALTGHLVFSTLHTNNAGGTIPRLVDLGVEPKVIGSALSVSMAQRLIRKLCDDCKKSYSPTDEEKKLMEKISSLIKAKSVEVVIPSTLFKASGCKKCHGTGYKGRIGIFEAILMDEDIESVISEHPSEREIWRTAKKQKILTMPEDGILKIIEGITSFDEVSRVVSLGELY